MYLYNTSYWLSYLNIPGIMRVVALCSQDGVLYAQIMCSNSMECLVKFWNRLIFAYLAQDCHLSLQTYVIGSRGMGKAFVCWQSCTCLVFYLVLILMFNTLNPISMCWSQMVSNGIVHFCFQNYAKIIFSL